MRNLFKILLITGIIGIIGTAGESELLNIDFTGALKQLALYAVLTMVGTYGVFNTQKQIKKAKIIDIKAKNVA